MKGRGREQGDPQSLHRGPAPWRGWRSGRRMESAYTRLLGCPRPVLPPTPPSMAPGKVRWPPASGRLVTHGHPSECWHPVSGPSPRPTLLGLHSAGSAEESGILKDGHPGTK